MKHHAQNQESLNLMQSKYANANASIYVLYVRACVRVTFSFFVLRFHFDNNNAIEKNDRIK